MTVTHRLTATGGATASIPVDTDDALTGDSDIRVPSQQAVKDFVTNTLVRFDDVTGHLTGASLYSVPGTADYDFAEGCVVFQPSGDITDDGDCIVLSLQIPHSAKTGAPLLMHCHFEQTSELVRTFTFQYRVQVNGAAKVTAWTEAESVSTTTEGVLGLLYVDGTLNQVARLCSVPITGLSSIVQFRLTRSDATAGNVNVNFIDGHIEKDSTGSRQEYIK